MVAVVSVDEDLIVVRLVRDFLGHASILALPGRPELPDCAARIGMIWNARRLANAVACRLGRQAGRGRDCNVGSPVVVASRRGQACSPDSFVATTRRRTARGVRDRPRCGRCPRQ